MYIEMRRFIFGCAVLLFMTACVGENGYEQEEKVNIQGSAQKGQLVKGSQVTAFALNNNLSSLGQSYPAIISDDLGSFNINASTAGKYLELRAEGYYFVENTGTISDSPIYLQSLVESKEENANINLLTTLAAPRIKYLVSTGVGFKDAKQQAQTEILVSLTKGAYTSAVNDFDELDISKGSEDNAVLLAMSCLLQQGRNTGEALELIAEISSEVEKTGSISEKLVDRLYASSESLDILSIINNLKSFYNRKGLTNYSIPAFYKYVGAAFSDKFVVLNKDVFEEDNKSGYLFIRGISSEGGSFDLFFLSPVAVNIILVDEAGEDCSYNWVNSKVERYEQIANVAHFEIASNPNPRRRAYINIVDADNNILQSLYVDQDIDSTKESSDILETSEATDIEAASAVLHARLDLSGVQYDDIKFGFFIDESETTLNTEFKCAEILDNSFSLSLTGLSHNTRYWYRAFVTLDGHTLYGETKTFTTSIIPVEGIKLDLTEYHFDSIGSKLKLNATILPEDATDKKIYWASDDNSVVTVDNNGLITARGNGTATITATTRDQEKTATCEVEVRQYVLNIIIEESLIELIKGQEHTLIATVSPENAYDKSVSWTSSNEQIAKVDSNGKVTAMSTGTATIKAQANDGSGAFSTCKVQVKNPVSSIVLDKTTMVIYRGHTNTSETLSATVYPLDADDNSLLWESSNTDIALVSQQGMVEARQAGAATITASANDGSGVTASCEVEVRQYVTRIILETNALPLLVGKNAIISVTSVSPDNAYDKTYSWTSSDKSIATVDNTGKVTAKSTGTAFISATANDGSNVSATCEVVVFEEKVDMGIKTTDGKTIYWSTCNLCESGFVNSPYDFGDYYAWGEVEPYNGLLNPDSENWAAYKWCNGSFDSLTKYNTNSSYGSVDNKTVLEMEDDVANLRLGGSWRMPTNEEWRELLKKCTWILSNRYGVDGMLITADNGNSIFLPGAHFMEEQPNLPAANWGYYWSSSVITDLPFDAYGISFCCLESDYYSFGAYGGSRCSGLSIRPVYEE